MKIWTTTLFFFIVASTQVNAQGKRQQEEIIVKKTLCLKYENDQLFFFEVGKEDEHERFEKDRLFSLKKRYANIYMKWLNPLKYAITWNDSMYTDQRDAIISSFFTSGNLPFILDETTENNAPQKMEYISNSEPLEDIQFHLFDQTKASSFSDISLIVWEREMKSIHIGKNQLKNSTEYEAIYKLLLELDQNKNDSIAIQLESYFTSLFNVSTISKSKELIKGLNTHIKQSENWLKTSKEKLTELVVLSKHASFSKDSSVLEYTKQVIQEFVHEKNIQNAVTENLITSLSKMITIVTQSYATTLSERDEYVPCKIVQFDEGKQQDVTIRIIHRELEKNPKRVVETEKSYSRKMTFRQYDIIEPSLSTGLFISKTNLSNFGVSSNSSNELEISEDNSSENLLLAAAFLHLNFNVGSRYFSPLLEFGIDPTKERPFLLLGTGFTIPAVNFGLTSGLMWTWDQELENGLQEGDVIESTSLLKANTRYEFSTLPLGWYVGIHYNF